MSNAWVNFMHNGDPNAVSGQCAIPAAYPVYSTKEDDLLVLDEPGMAEAFHVREKYCDTWDKLGYFY